MKPLCPDCGDRHEKYQAHVWKTPEVKKGKFQSVANTVANEKPVANTVVNAVANKKRKPGKYKDPEARKVYMRELMRKKRLGARG